MFGMSRKSKAYSALPSDNQDRTARVSTGASSTYILLTFICVLCAVLNTILLTQISGGLRSSDEKATTTFGVQELRRPSQYIHLDSVARPSPPVPRNFVNHPILVSIIDSDHTHKVAEVDARRYMSHNGMISPPERHYIIADTVSTIVQFRAIDYGMELCEIHVHLPPLFPGPPTDAEEPSVVATLHRLNSTLALDERKVSFASRPPRVFKVDDITVTPWHYRFSCVSEKVLTFELSHLSYDGSDETSIEWWQNDDGLRGKPAIFMKQHSTK
ncbi:uncharacterized protein B0H18DRAFT_996833 [Fomitopsis serialis]|uniref:uncharacterized protein n=1 Tax=Fomitopsis serialis TaxID=139415 RepID=UPI002007E991|nr:uncharacterized protein B0H18DRAFT_996833 [Neoantrodia serialis]KAH9929374.1 hypothetical protein B0H18DRAFT_996833 [Neoantrodia serialis]